MRALLALVGCVAISAAPHPLEATVTGATGAAIRQAVAETDQALDTIPTVEPSAPAEVTPGGAFLRALLVPGWGHAATESYGRGGFYVAAQSATLWMLVKSTARHREAVRFQRLEREVVESRLRSEGVVNPDSLRLLAEQDPAMERWDDLRASRSQQVEDWAAVGIFLVLLSAVDAFVAAHLQDQPEPLSMEVTPPLGRGGWEVRITVPASFPRLPGLP